VLVAYRLITGQDAQMTVAGLGIVPLYSHMATATGDDMVPPPLGSVTLLSDAPWTLLPSAPSHAPAGHRRRREAVGAATPKSRRCDTMWLAASRRLV
jgi:hypothetical protein